MKQQVIFLFFTVFTLGFCGVPRDRFNPCFLTVSGCKDSTLNAPSSTTEVPKGKGFHQGNDDIKSKLVNFSLKPIRILNQLASKLD